MATDTVILFTKRVRTHCVRSSNNWNSELSKSSGLAGDTVACDRHERGAEDGWPRLMNERCVVFSSAINGGGIRSRDFPAENFCAGLMSGGNTSPVQRVESVANMSPLVSPAAIVSHIH